MRGRSSRRPLPASALAFLWLGGLLSLLGGPAARGQEADFGRDAQAALAAEKWPDLENLARARLAEDAEDRAGRAYLAFALAGQQKFDEAIEELVAAAGGPGEPLPANIPGIGDPCDRIVNIIYAHCWADFSADFNRRAWSALFEAFPGTPNVAVAATRLLMAALLTGDAGETRRFEEWFETRLAELESNRAAVGQLSHYFSQGYLRAGRAPPRAVALAEEAYRIAVEQGEALYARTSDPLEKREKVDVSADTQYWFLAQAYAIAERFDPPENILAEHEPEPGAVFEDATESATLAGQFAGRVAAADYDGDGFADLCFSGRLFHNRKGKAFHEVTQEAGITATGSGALFFDYDNDGWLDLLVAAAPHPFLFRNKGKKGRFAFENVTAAAGLDRMSIGGPPEGAAVLDIDNDGWLEFYLAVYENPYPTGHPDLLARNNGDGTFRDVSEESGIRAVEPACGRGVACADFDQDGDTDIYVSNYRLQENFLWQNDGGGRFTNAAPGLGVQGVAQHGAFGHTIGSCFGDVDNDGDRDLFCANLAHPRFIQQGFSNLSMLYLCSAGEAAGSVVFAEERRQRGIRFQETHSDPAFADFDNDGDLDLSITCIYKNAPSCLYQNDGQGRFEPVTFRTRSVAFDGWGQAWFDMENDGDLDRVVGSGSGIVLHRNRGNENHWLAVKLEGSKQNLFAVGARVTVTTPDGRTQVREVGCGRGTTSQDGYVLHFGLGAEAAEAQVEVLWPTGNTTKRAARADRLVEMKNPKSYRTGR